MKTRSSLRFLELSTSLAVVLTTLWLVAGVHPAWSTTVHVTDDAGVDLARPGVNLGHAPTMSIASDAVGGLQQAFVKFDVSVLPSPAEVRRAVLRLWVGRVVEPGSVTVHEVLGDWQESTVTAEMAPFFAPAFASFHVDAADQHRYVTVDVTHVVQGWMLTPDGNFGLALQAAEGAVLQVEFDSKENTATSHAVELEVALVQAAPPANGAGMSVAGPPGPPGPPGPAGPGALVPGTPCASTEFLRWDGKEFVCADFATLMSRLMQPTDILAPEDGASDAPRLLTLSWKAMPTAKSYRVILDDNKDFSSPIIDGALTEEPAFETSGTLEASTQFYWRVLSCSGPLGSGVCAMSRPASFTTGLNIHRPFRSCLDAREQGQTESGNYRLDPDGAGGESGVELYCDMTTDGGGWTIIHIAATPNEDAAQTPYSMDHNALLESASEVLVGYRDESLTLSPGWARFSMPTAWRSQHPLAYSARTESITISVEGGTPISTHLHHGTGNWNSDKCSNVGFIPMPQFGLMCFEGTSAPFYTGFAHPMVDTCARSDQPFNARACDASRMFTIGVR